MLELYDNEFYMIRDYIKKNYGINLSDEKKSLVYSRLKSVVQEMKLSSFTDYFNCLKEDGTGETARKFIDRITTNHTYFMRENEHFDYLTNIVLPYIETKYKTTKDVRIWSTGCSTGEEAYTLQIILKEYFINKPGWNTQLLATDVSGAVLEKAYRGVYSDQSLAVLPESWRRKYFKKYDDSHSEAADILKKDIVFRRFNLMQDMYRFKKDFQIIFCRNVMIYFDSDTRYNLVNKLYSVTDEGGYLFIGHSESLNHTDTKYKYIMPAVYRKMEQGQ